MTGNITLLIIVGVVMFAVLGGVTLIAHIYSLNGIKSRTVGDGQHGTARPDGPTALRFARPTNMSHLPRSSGVNRQRKANHP